MWKYINNTQCLDIDGIICLDFGQGYIDSEGDVLHCFDTATDGWASMFSHECKVYPNKELSWYKVSKDFLFDDEDINDP